LDPATFAAMVDFMKDFLRCDRYAVLSSLKASDPSHLAKKTKKKRVQEANAADIELRRSLRAKNSQAQQKLIDLTGKQKKGKQKKRHTPAGSNDSLAIEHEKAMKALQAQALLAQLDNAQRDVEQINEIKRLREQLESTQPLIAASVLPPQGKRPTSSTTILSTSPALVQAAPHSISVHQTGNQQWISQFPLPLILPQPQSQILGHSQAPPPHGIFSPTPPPHGNYPLAPPYGHHTQAPPPHGHYPQAPPPHGHYPQASPHGHYSQAPPPHGHYPHAPPPHGQQYYQGISSFYISSSNH
jgi:hypothetical protein